MNANATITTKRVRIGIVGNLLGRNAGYVTTQGYILATLFEKDGYEVISASSRVGRFHRLLDVVWTVLRNHRKVDVWLLEVYSGLGFVIADIASFLVRLFRVPTIMVLHGGNLPEFGKRHPWWFKRVLRRAAALVAPSSFLAVAIQQDEFVVRIVPNVIDLGRYAFRLRQKISPKLLWMRSFHPIYNPQMALDAFSEVRLEFPDATLVMAGVDKGLENSVKNSAQQMGLGNAVRFPGFLDEHAKIREFSEADIYLNTNRLDNMPVSVVEACAMGLPVVATAVGGLSHLIDHGKNGLLVPDNDPNKMAAAIMTLLRDQDLTERLSVNGRLLAEKSAWTSVRSSWEVLFNEILTEENGSDRRRSSPLLIEAHDK